MAIKIEQSHDPVFRRLAFDFLACVLILAGHFANHVFYTGYDRLFPDLALCALLLAAVAVAITAILQIPSTNLRTLVFALLVVTVFSDSVFEYGTTGGGAWVATVMVSLGVVLVLCFILRRYINIILVAVFGAILVSVVVSGLVEGLGEKREAAVSSARADLPVVVHIVLDEQAGLAAMAPELPGGGAVREAMRVFYTDNGFRLFTRAYSRYFETHASLARAFNPNLGPSAVARAEKHRNKYVLVANDYFRHWAKLGYRLNVLQSSYLDFCHVPNAAIANCRTYRHDAIAAGAIAGLRTGERVALLMRIYASSLTLAKLVRLAERVVLPRLQALGLPIASFGVWHGRVGPLAVVGPFDAFIADVAKSQGGDMFFAHLLMPHYPYVYDRNCAIRRPVGAWRLRTEHGSGANTADGRRLRYDEYFQQVLCTLKKLMPLWEAMRAAGTFDRALVVVHGDHGARVTRADPRADIRTSMTRNDFVDSFSTLFAVRTPGSLPGTDPRMAALGELLKGIVLGHGESMRLPRSPLVYLRAEDGSYVEAFMPVFRLIQ